MYFSLKSTTFSSLLAKIVVRKKHYSIFMKKSIYFLLLFFICFSIQAQIELKNDKDSYVIGKSISYLKDPTTLLTFEDILKKNADFKPSNQESLNFGFTEDVIWLKCLVDNQSDFEDWVLSLTTNSINYLDFYYQEGEEWKSIKTGNLLPFENKEINDIGFSFFLNLDSQTKKIYYLRAKSEFPLTIPIVVQRHERFSDFTRSKNLYYGGYFGILLVMILYNLFIYLTLKDKNYLYYVFTIAATFAVFFSVTGYAYMLIWQNLPSLNLLTFRVFMNLLVISTAIFTIHFLHLKKYAKLFYFWMILNIALAILASILNHFGFFKSLINNIVSFHVIICLVTGIVVWKKGYVLAKYYFFAWLIYALGGAIITFRNTGLLPSTIFTIHAVEIGSILEVIIISFALSEKYRILKKENDISNKKALEVQAKANQELESKVNQRTIELQATIELVNKQNIDIERKNIAIEKTNNNINSSITYASRIQEAILAIDHEVKIILPEHFIFFKPRDVVSGDFYFFAKKASKIIIAVADCTGHGIPGAMMSMIGESYLSQIVLASKELEVNEILSEMHKKVSSALSQDTNDFSVQDGMDMTICIIDKENKRLEFAGAKHALIYIQANQIHQIKGTKLPIGGRKEGKVLRTYEKHIIPIETQMSVYLSTDGFKDQFGGEENKKFMSKNFKNLLLKNHKKTLPKQEQIIENTFLNWKGKGRQIDDVLVVGFRLDNDFMSQIPSHK